VLRDFMVNRCRPFIFATAPSPLTAVAVQEALLILQQELDRQQRLADLVAFTHRQIGARGGWSPSNSQIVPYIVGDNARAMTLAAALQARGFDIRGIRPPTVPAGTARLRISLTLNVDEDDVRAMVDALTERRGSMSRRIVVTGTDTEIGKTIFSAALASFLGANYWKPIQAGLDGETDSRLVARLGGLSDDRIVPERYRLKTPASPHYAAEIDGIRIDVESLALPDSGEQALVIEGAGGLMVPLDRSKLYIDVFARWQLPVVLCARTALGTINHSLLSIEALRHRKIDILGIAFIGEGNPSSERTICEIGSVRRLGRLPWLSPLTATTLRAAFEASFSREDFKP
jgi:dethiobiotin synthetase